MSAINWAALGLPDQLPVWSWWVVGFAAVAALFLLLGVFLRALIWIALVSVPLYIAAAYFVWPSAWMLHFLFWVPFGLGLLLFIGGKRLAGKILAIVAAILILATGLYGTLDSKGVFTPPSTVSCDTSSITSGTALHFYTEDPGKEVTRAFGTNANQGSIDGDLQEYCKRLTIDPSLVAGDETAFGMIPPTAQAATNEELTLLNDRTHWKAAVDQIFATLKEAQSITTQGVKAGSHSLYMVPTADGSFVNFGQGNTSHDGTMLVIVKKDGTKVELRLDCGFQPIFPTPPKGFPECKPNSTHCNPAPPVCPPGYSGPGWNPVTHQLVCKDPGSEGVGANPAVAPWKQDGGQKHSVSDGDGATISNGYQANPQGDAQKATDQANQQNQQQEQQHDDAVKDATVGSTDETHGAATDPNKDGSPW